jgi:hypothetical protein
MAKNKKYIDKEINHLREIISINKESNDKALDIFTKENDRRHENLNHENERILAIQKNSVSRELHDTIEKRIHTLELSRATLEGKASQISVTITIIISVIALILGLIDIILKMYK